VYWKRREGKKEWSHSSKEWDCTRRVLRGLLKGNTKNSKVEWKERAEGGGRKPISLELLKDKPEKFDLSVQEQRLLSLPIKTITKD